MPRTPMFRQFLRALQQARRDNLAEAGEAAPVTRTDIRLTRRGFLKVAALGGAGLAAGLGRPRTPAFAYPGVSPRIAVVGGGIAGLNAAYQLKQAGYTATVYEARSRLGGRIRSIDGLVGKGLTTDLGGAFINSDHEDMLALAEAFGLTLFDRAADAERLGLPASAYLFDGRAIPEAELAKQLRLLADQIAADAALLDDDFEANAPQFDELSVTQYLDQHRGRIRAPFVRRLVENSIRTEYGVEPHESSALQLLFLLPTVGGASVEVLGSSDELFTVQGGSGRIIEGLGSALAGQVQVRKRLTRIEGDGAGFRLTFNRNERVEADYVVLAIPFPVLRKLDIQVELPETLRAFIDEVDLGRNEKLFAGVREKAWRRADGFALDAWTDAGCASVWDETQRQSDRSDGVLTLFHGGREVDELTRGGTPLHGRRLLGQLDRALPGLEQASNKRFFRTHWHRSFFTGGAYTNFKPGQYLAFAEHLYIEAEDPEERQDVHVGNLVFAGEHLSDAFYGYMNGGAETGRLAAELIVRLVSGEEPEARSRLTRIYAG